MMKKRFHFWGPKRVLKEVEEMGEPWCVRDEEEVYVTEWEEKVTDLEEEREGGGQ